MLYLYTLQASAGWRLDLLSLLIGLIGGVLLVIGVLRVLPRLRQLQAQTAERVQETQAWVRAGVEKRYQAEMAEYVRNYHLGSPWATLADIFVVPRVLAPPPPVEPQEPERPVLREVTYMWPDLAAGIAVPPVPTMTLRQLLLNGRRVIISAPQGAGKTTLLAYCAHLCAHATNTGPYVFLLPMMPVLVHLAELDLAEINEDPATPLTQVLQRRVGPLTASGVPDLLQEKLSNGHVLLLLDGWDELSAERQEEPITWLDRLLDRYPEIQVIAAAAVEGYEPLQTLAFTLSGLAPWRAYQADQLAAQWAEALGRPGRFRPDTYWQPGQGPLGTTFHLLWQQHAAADDFIPETRAELLSASLPFLLAQGTVEETMKTATLELWQTLAYSLFAEKKLSLSRTTINAWLDTLLATHGIDERHASSLRQSLLQSGLFVQWHDKSYSLLSPVWRNFLAAAYLEAQQQHQNVVDHLQEPYWNGTIRFYTARAGESGLSEWLLDPRSRDPFRAGLFQVASWLPETRDAGEWRRQTLIQLGQLAVKQGAPLALRQRAVAAIAQSGESGILALLRQLLQRADPQLRQAATASLPRFESETSVPILESMMQDDDQDVRVVAVHALGWQNSPLGERPLLIALIGQDEKMSRAAAEELALNRGEGWQILREAATDDAVSVRRVAAYGLGLLDAHWAVELLGEMEVNDDEWAVKSAAGLALEATAARNQQTTWKPQQAGDLAWLVQWAASQERSVPAGAMAINTLCEILETAQQAAIRFAAARSLGQVMIPPQRKDAVLAYLQNAIRRDPDREVREVAFRTLVKLHRAAGQTKA